MKVTYNWLKDFVDLKISAWELAEKLTMSGLEVKAVQEKAGDFVFEIEITSNRPDWLSVMGIAREAAAITNAKLRAYSVERIASSKKLSAKRYPLNAETLKIDIENTKDCPFYTARIIRGIKVGVSPQWLKDRLELVGVRSVNNVVDITNYVLLEMGEPLHAFDLDKIVSQPDSRAEIIVRRAQQGEEIVSIDGAKRVLDESVLIIAAGARRRMPPLAAPRHSAAAGKPIAIAGVMGGKDTEVGAGAQNILLEAAIFNPLVIRRGRQKLGLSSEASYRFERGVDSSIALDASARAAQLIQQFCAGNSGAAKSSGSVWRKELTIDFAVGAVKRHLGIAISAGKLKNIFLGLGFSLKAKNKNTFTPLDSKHLTGFTVKVPSWRLDIKTEIDLIEEAARIYGYENIPSTLASVVLKNREEKFSDYISLIKDVLIACGLNEVITYSLIERKSLRGFWDKKDAVIEIANPLSLEQEIMRPALMSSLAQRIAYNLRQQISCVKIFEIAKIYKLENNGLVSDNQSHKLENNGLGDVHVQEKYSLGLALCGTESKWLGPKQGYAQNTLGFLHLKGIIETLGERLGLEKAQYRFVHNNEVEVLIKGEKAGLLRKLPGEILADLDIKHKEVFAAEIFLEEKIFPMVALERKFNIAAVPRYPGISRDLTLPVKSEVTFEEISAAIYGLKEPLLTNLGFQDCYEGEKVSPGTKRITVALRYCSSERTLTEEEIVPVHTRLIQALETKFQIKII